MAKPKNEIKVYKGDGKGGSFEVKEVALPETVNVLAMDFATEQGVRQVVHAMKQNALNNYLILAKIENAGAFKLLGYEDIDSFIKSELKGIVSYQNAVGFLSYVHEQTQEIEQFDEMAISNLLGIYKEETKETGKEKKKDPSKDRIIQLKKELENKEQAIIEKESEMESLKEKLETLARDMGKDPDRVMLVKSEESLRNYIDEHRIKAIQHIRSLKELDHDLLQRIGYSELQMSIASIQQAYSEVLRQYEQYFFTSDLIEKLGA